MAQAGDVNSVAVLVLFFNKLDQTKDCIRSFIPSGQMIYVLNNGSSEDQWQDLQQAFATHSNIKYYNAGKNLGATGGRNYLIKKTTEPWLFLVDNDIIIEPGDKWLAIFKEYVRNNPTVEIICPRLFNVHENEYGSHPKFILKDDEVSLLYANQPITNYFPSGASLVRRSVFNKYGLFEEGLFAFEDYEFAIRLLCTRANSLQAYTLNDITLVHNHRFQKKKADKEAVKTRYDDTRLKQSFKLMEEKYGIRFNHEWEWWSKQQVKKMTNKSCVQKLKSIIKNILNH